MERRDREGEGKWRKRRDGKGTEKGGT